MGACGGTANIARPRRVERKPPIVSIKGVTKWVQPHGLPCQIVCFFLIPGNQSQLNRRFNVLSCTVYTASLGVYIYIHNGHSWQCSFLANLCSFESTFVKKTALPKLAVQQLHPAGKPDQLTKYVKKIRESWLNPPDRGQTSENMFFVVYMLLFFGYSSTGSKNFHRVLSW